MGLAKELREAIIECNARGLTESARWAALQLTGLPDEEAELAGADALPAPAPWAPEDDRHALAKCYFDSKVTCSAVSCDTDGVQGPCRVPPSCTLLGRRTLARRTRRARVWPRAKGLGSGVGGPTRLHLVDNLLPASPCSAAGVPQRCPHADGVQTAQEHLPTPVCHVPFGRSAQGVSRGGMAGSRMDQASPRRCAL